MVPSLGIRYALWTSRNLRSSESVAEALRPALDDGSLSQHDFDAACASSDLHTYAAAPIYGVASGALTAVATLVGLHLLARRLRVPDMLRTTLRSSPLLLPFLATAPVCLGYSAANMIQAAKYEAFAAALDDRAAFGDALGRAGRGAVDDAMVRAWGTRLIGYGQAGTIAPPKDELLPYMNHGWASAAGRAASASTAASSPAPAPNPLSVEASTEVPGDSGKPRRWW
ncbi:hypothetical protein K488DRAFT_88123 [Vararia minispora EC-137]|uniref:Uncharacterized protein n=1 Tax=Vararia minispora EC-137 TaxID=1314806 RepID=A0ACB8QEQ7_9AGAM|nr:hypothetical protein K488DRAFT_88123 [Vararia minispora EC-137]